MTYMMLYYLDKDAAGSASQALDFASNLGKRSVIAAEM
jgi:hypothetical protein